ncbi:DUF445 domain-containing protein [Halobacteriovorax marinus]|uniref:DUF445 domain-containing protein n=1 Tax=Halobacteriovorax marinus TaxID=97084 RepID=A0A1Y5FC42_9BACT|nr:DUF445 domain-containing protein [Halobacteriovorax marinus]
MNKSLLTNGLSIALIGVGYITPMYSHEVKTMGLYSFSGAITNWLAIHMLFEKIPFLYGSGIITERFEEFKEGIRNMIMNQFFTQENFEKFLSENKSSLIQIEEESIFEAIDFDKIFVKLKGAITESSFGPMLAMFGGEEALEPLKPHFEAKFKESIAEIIEDEKFIDSLMKGSEGNSSLSDSVSEIVNSRLDELTPLMVKEIIQEMIREHLGWLVVWGGVFGALIGLVTTLI